MTSKEDFKKEAKAFLKVSFPDIDVSVVKSKLSFGDHHLYFVLLNPKQKKEKNFKGYLKDLSFVIGKDLLVLHRKPNPKEEKKIFLSWFRQKKNFFPSYDSRKIFKGIIPLTSGKASLAEIFYFLKYIKPDLKKTEVSDFSKIIKQYGLELSFTNTQQNIKYFLSLVNQIEKLHIKTNKPKYKRTATNSQAAEIATRIERILKSSFPTTKFQVIVGGSSNLGKKLAHQGDLDIGIMVEDSNQIKKIERFVIKIKSLSSLPLDVVVVPRQVLYDLKPVYKYAHLYHGFSLNSKGPVDYVRPVFDSSSFFLSEYKIQAKFLLKEPATVSERALKKIVFFNNALWSKDVMSSIDGFKYDDFYKNSKLGQLLIQENFRYTEKFAKHFKQNLRQLYPKAMKHLQEIEMGTLHKPSVDPFFAKEMKSGRDWKTSYKKSLYKVLFGN